MPLGDSYATLEELKAYIPNNEMASSGDDDLLSDALASVSSEIESYCGRQFNKTDTATVRDYGPDEVFALREGSIVTRWARVDDFHDTAGLVVESGGTTWSASDYVLHPRNGVVNGQPGWPYCEVYAAGSASFSTGLSVTAKWGWTAVPAPVKQACLILAAETAHLRNAPLGVAGMDQFGVVRVRDNRMAAAKLARYCRDPIRVR